VERPEQNPHPLLQEVVLIEAEEPGPEHRTHHAIAKEELVLAMVPVHLPLRFEGQRFSQQIKIGGNGGH
jgi:hypothetical protein